MSRMKKTQLKACLCAMMLSVIPCMETSAASKLPGSDEAPQSQQKKTVTGTVRDSKGEAIVGANVIVKGTMTGTFTDIDGNYSLSVPSNGTLSVSMIGFTTHEIKIGNQNVINVVLSDDTQLLNEAVFIGYGTQKKVNLTGAVDVVSSEVLDNRPVSNLTQGLQGAIPNLQITFADGKPNRSSDYQVRGTGSIGQGGSALVLIDGVEGDPAMLNPSDVASVSVLKDASSAAIYGARGTYGVILITTKDPNKEKTSVTYSSNFLMKSPTVVPDVVTDGLEFTEYYLKLIVDGSMPLRASSTPRSKSLTHGLRTYATERPVSSRKATESILITVARIGSIFCTRTILSAKNKTSTFREAEKRLILWYPVVSTLRTEYSITTLTNIRCSTSAQKAA